MGIIFTLTGRGIIFLCCFFSVVIHEMAHSRMAELRGYRLRRIVLMPYGAVLKGGENFPKKDSVLIALAGPLVNLIIALLLTALWWLFPDCYNYTSDLMWANLSVALFNIIPVFPLDGARVILAMADKKAVTLRRLRTTGIILAVILAVLMVVSIFYKFNISLGVMAVFIMHGALSGTDKELYSHIMTFDKFNKTITDAVTYSDIGISYKAPMFRFLEQIRPDRIVTFHILDDDCIEVMKCSETDIKNILMNNELSAKFSDCVSVDILAKN